MPDFAKARYVELYEQRAISDLALRIAVKEYMIDLAEESIKD